MAHGVHTAVDRVQTADPYAILDLARREPKGQKLLATHHPLLPVRDRRDRAVDRFSGRAALRNAARGHF